MLQTYLVLDIIIIIIIIYLFIYLFIFNKVSEILSCLLSSVNGIWFLLCALSFVIITDWGFLHFWTRFVDIIISYTTVPESYTEL